MCGQMNCCCRRCCCRGGSIRQSTGCPCGCGCGQETAAPTATISMADFEPFVLVPTSVFDQGDVDCDCDCGCRCGCDCGCDW